jgi:hypothetical protein
MREQVEGKVLIGFRVSESFQKRIESECIKREMSLQDLIGTALKQFFTLTPPASSNIFSAAASEFMKSLPPAEASADERSEFEDWLGLWVKYINDMPREKVLLIVEVLKLDLLHYRSSRRKAGLRRRKAGQKGEANA